MKWTYMYQATQWCWDTSPNLCSLQVFPVTSVALPAVSAVCSQWPCNKDVITCSWDQCAQALIFAHHSPAEVFPVTTVTGPAVSAVSSQWPWSERTCTKQFTKQRNKADHWGSDSALLPSFIHLRFEARRSWLGLGMASSSTFTFFTSLSLYLCLRFLSLARYWTQSDGPSSIP